MGSFFKKAALSAVFCLAVGCNDDSTPPEVPSTSSVLPASLQAELTTGETALVQSIFGTEINTAIVEKHFEPNYRRDKVVSGVSDEKTINFYGAKYYSADFSQEKDIFNYGDFMNVMTYIWRAQTNRTGTCDTYQYRLNPAYHFDDYCSEQQAAIIEDYARHFLHPKHVHTYKSVSSRDYTNDDTLYSYVLLAKVVEDQFPEAHKTRLALEAQGQPKLTMGTPLTQGEVALVQSVFGTEINTAIVEKFLDPNQQGDTVANAYDKKTIQFYEAIHHSADFSQEKEAYNYGVFMHELTHIWQKQASPARDCKLYKYPLDAKYQFTDYCDEQQAAIIEDYVTHFLHPEQASTYRYTDSEGNTGNDTPSSDALLVKLVEDRFPQAHQTRLAIEAQREAQKQFEMAKKAAEIANNKYIGKGRGNAVLSWFIKNAI
jgi:hypothetical protein